MTTYIHYGANRFDLEEFKPIRNEPCFTKPMGGLWASDIEAPYGWRDWCEDEHFHMDQFEKFFQFHLSEDANVFFVDSHEKLEQLPQAEGSIPKWYLIDFEAALAQGIDAIEISISKCTELYWDLYGWDCDSILIMNKDVIVPE